MKKVIISVISSIILNLITPYISNAEENTMYFDTEGVVFPCLNEDTHPWGTCFMVDGNRWGLDTPMFDPKPGEMIKVTFVLKRYLDKNRKHEDMFYVSNIIINIPEEVTE